MQEVKNNNSLSIFKTYWRTARSWTCWEGRGLVCD